MKLSKALNVLHICEDFWKVESLTGRPFFFVDLLLAANRKGLKTNTGSSFSLHARAASSLLSAAYTTLAKAGIEDRWKLLEIKGSKGGYLWRK